MKFDLGFGYTGCIREALISEKIMPNDINFNTLDYPSEEAKNKLTNLTKRLCFDIYGQKPEHICIVGGAMNGLDILTRILKPNNLIINKNHFAYYNALGENSVISKYNMVKIRSIHTGRHDVVIIDSPNNPTGSFLSPKVIGKGVSIWDSVYHNPVYCNIFNPYKGSNFTVGSFGKLLGISGVKLGFIATNDGFTATKANQMVEENHCGLNAISIDIVTKILKQELNGFYTRARYNIDSNRSEINKLSYLFESTPPENGMFYYPQADSKLRKLITDSDVVFIDGKYTGDESRIRLNMCADRNTIKEAVNAIIKQDRRK